eukprot:769091-Alexandrium_andersonii.AAC.1
MQVQTLEAPREARHLLRPPLNSGTPMFTDSEPRRGPFGLLGNFGPRPRNEGSGQSSYGTLTRGS